MKATGLSEIPPKPKRIQIRGHRPSKFDRGEFVAWDGEGVSPVPGKPQRYVLFGNRQASLTASEGGELRTAQILPFLIEQGKAHPGAIHVIFAGGYDANMIVRDLPPKAVTRLYRRGEVRWPVDQRIYKLEYRPSKSFYVRDITDEKYQNGKCTTSQGPSIRLWDVWPFFQSSFLKALRTWKIGTTEDLERIESGKKDRSQFNYQDIASITEYWHTELILLEQMMESFRTQLLAADFQLKRWDGPGAIASFLYQKHKTKAHQGVPDEDIARAARHAYAGGRIELFRYGNRNAGDIRVYDINSAYPAGIARLPSLKTASWRSREGNVHRSVPYSLYHLKVGTADLVRGRRPDQSPLMPLWHRNAFDGSVNFTTDFHGWYWTPEYEQAIRHFPTKVEVLEWYEFTGDTEFRPFKWVADMYEQRRRWKREGNPAERVLKLGLNSLYGKMAQQKGYRPCRYEDKCPHGEGWRKCEDQRHGYRPIPPFHQLEWAGYVTSSTRAQLFDAMMRNPTKVIGVETDSVIVEGELPGLPIGDRLGEWSEERYQGVTYLQPGVYWLKQGKEWIPKNRGFDPDSLNRENILEQMRNYQLGCGERTVYVARSTRFMGMGLATSTGNWDTWRTWITSDRELRYRPGYLERVARPNGSPWTAQGNRKRGAAHDSVNKAVTRLQPTSLGIPAGGEMSASHKLLWIDGPPNWWWEKDPEDWLSASARYEIQD